MAKCDWMVKPGNVGRRCGRPSSAYLLATADDSLLGYLCEQHRGQADQEIVLGKLTDCCVRFSRPTTPKRRKKEENK